MVDYLPKHLQATWRRKLQRAYEKPSYAEAKAALERLKPELKLINVSALRSLEEGFEETLTLHRLGLFAELGVSFKTTNCIESLMALLSRYTDKVDRWRNSSQKYSDPLIDCTSNKRYSWMKGGASWITKGTASRRLKGGPLGGKRIWL